MDWSVPRVAVDIVACTTLSDRMYVLLIRRSKPPFLDAWFLPGGFMELNESAEQAARREFREETGLEVTPVQFRTYSEPGRDPRGHVISIAHVAELTHQEPCAGFDAAHAQWHPVEDLPELGFDHHRIVNDALAFVKTHPLK